MSLAPVCAAKGYLFEVVWSDAFSEEKLLIMRALWAQLTIVPSDAADRRGADPPHDRGRAGSPTDPGRSGPPFQHRTMASAGPCSYTSIVRREDAILALRGLLPKLRRDFGVRRLALFGSTARDEASEGSDLDLLVDFESGPTFDSFMG